ncbi:hypothetical protein [Aeoliella mucimassa]|uniref:Uncharacterized protein n=1 Tax=Aeoliella mucimassa TaxID=2527972 RepID=A0A518AWG3_9BACT|nr:hypothetical protein [Aeoliella mucimassa]QDU59064.1 hypothetical protein Pan181_53050 [Aeoliella mucimassa]
MKQSGQCPKCGSNHVIEDAKAIDHYDYGVQQEMQVGVDRNPNAWIFKAQAKSAVSAWLCAECGYVEFYADDPNTLAKAVQEAKDR